MMLQEVLDQFKFNEGDGVLHLSPKEFESLRADVKAHGDGDDLDDAHKFRINIPGSYVTVYLYTERDSNQ